MMRVHLVNPSDTSFGTAVITPRWLYVLAAATPESFGDPVICDETLEHLDPLSIAPGDVVGIGIHTGNALRGYRLGLQARERSSTGHDALPHMVDLLHKAAAADPPVDHGGPHRLLAILLLRAPGWPMGPGDVEAALPEARAAATIAPGYPPNQLAVGEALRKNGHPDEARAAYAEALRLATADSADPDSAGWADEARAALR